MAKILQIQNDLVLVGMDDGSTVELSKNDFSFEISESMEVEIYTHNDTYMISKSKNHPPFYQQEDEPPVQGKIYVNKINYGVLRLLTGSFGVHHFYAGNIKKLS